MTKTTGRGAAAVALVLMFAILGSAAPARSDSNDAGMARQLDQVEERLAALDAAMIGLRAENQMLLKAVIDSQWVGGRLGARFEDLEAAVSNLGTTTEAIAAAVAGMAEAGSTSSAEIDAAVAKLFRAMDARHAAVLNAIESLRRGDRGAGQPGPLGPQDFLMPSSPEGLAPGAEYSPFGVLTNPTQQ
ncbi:MAG: hypothetical protein QF926_12595 [Alphaproteobacteria bacterium]|jgi:hypothetical protein|nr:hypothetical protein [Alphaproteobacteria bacterium]MDP6517443.1 hypothetical protein [Alphaproteobacteria bacterium]